MGNSFEEVKMEITEKTNEIKKEEIKEYKNEKKYN